MIEHAFGLLTQRFGIFWRCFHFSFDRWSLVVLVCMKLNNLCLDRNLSVPLRRFYEDVREDDEWVVWDNVQSDDQFLQGRATCDRRRQIMQKLQDMGIVQPPHAAANSRT